MEKVNNVYLHTCIINDIEYSECFDENYERIDIVNFYRNNLKNNIDINTIIKDNVNLNKFEDECFLFTIDYHYKFHNCVIELLGMLYYYIKLKKSNENLKIVIKYNKFVIEYLQLLSFVNINNIIVIKTNELYWFKSLYLNRIRTRAKFFIKNLIQINKCLTINTIEKYPERIFLYRYENKRKLTSKSDIIEIAKKHNFFFYSPENDNANNHIGLISNCKILLCELSSGCSNMFFTNDKCKIIILSFSKKWSNKYIFYNNHIYNRQIEILEGKILKGREHNCIWYVDEKILDEKLKNL